VADDPDEPAFEALVEYLKTERGFDFSGYKRPSLVRRVRRQMQVAGIASFEEYQDYLEVHPEEFTALFNMILINVTSFFRDAEAWQELRETVLPVLLRARPSGVLRVWSAGCASGEEAYSLAICLAEAMGTEDFRERVKIYGTDVDEEALSEARQATYTPRQLASVPGDLVQRYFEPVNGGERLSFRKDLRRCVIFGRNDLVQDAPISRIDLLACRNTLMYFNTEQQSRIVQRLHFALNATGVLFIGKAETLWSHSALLVATDSKRRFFKKLPVEPYRDRQAELLRSVAGAARDLPEAVRLRDEALLSSPVAHVVIDRFGILAAANHRADALFGVGPRDIGRPFQDLELSYRPLELRSHIEQSLAERRPRILRDVEWSRGPGDPVYLEVQVVPLLDSAVDGGSYGVSLFLTDVTAHRRLQLELEFANRQLETAYEELHSTNEELETTNEELQSTVEELETTNEELQSTNEELETMNEELQSMNDELHASNEELRLRTLEVGEVNTFMESVLAGLRAAVMVVDREQRVLVWNRQAEDLWGVRREEAVGRHLLGLDIGLPLDRLTPVLRQVLADRAGSDGDGAAEPVMPELRLTALNRRGRSIDVRVSATALLREGATVAGAIVVVDPEPLRLE
jgi:two-component system CheB/CheR fusion protein